MHKRKWWLGIAIGMVAVLPAGVGLGQDASGLSLLMQRNLDHFNNLVRTAFFESVQKPLQPIDYQRLRQEAEAISGIALQTRQSFSRGDRFDQLAQELEKHAEEAASAAAKENLPEVNLQIGEMAEYCAECHNRFRWGRAGAQ